MNCATHLNSTQTEPLLANTASSLVHCKVDKIFKFFSQFSWVSSKNIHLTIMLSMVIELSASARVWLSEVTFIIVIVLIINLNKIYCEINIIFFLICLSDML